MKVLIDTNVILDIALIRQPFYDKADRIFAFIEQGKITGYISASTFGDLYYIIRKLRGKEWTIDFLKQLCSLCSVGTVDNSVISIALTANFGDFEDAIQYHTAVLNQVEAIVTHNSQDFPSTTIRILTPDQLIQEIITLSSS